MVQQITRVFSGYKTSSAPVFKKQITQQNISSPYSASNTSLDSSASSAARAMASASISFSGVFIPQKVSSAIEAADNMRHNADEKRSKINKLTEHTIKPITERANKMADETLAAIREGKKNNYSVVIDENGVIRRSFELNGEKPASMTEYAQDGSPKRKTYFLGNEWIGIEEGNIELFLKNNEIVEYREGVVYDYSPGGKDTIEKDLLFENGKPVLYKEGIEYSPNLERAAKKLSFDKSWNPCIYEEGVESCSLRGKRYVKASSELCFDEGIPILYKEGVSNGFFKNRVADRVLTYDEEGAVSSYQEGVKPLFLDSDKILSFRHEKPTFYADYNNDSEGSSRLNDCFLKIGNKWVRSKI